MHLQATATVKIQDIFLKYHSSDRWNLLTFHFRTVTTSGSFCPRTVEIRIEKIIQNLKQGMKKSGDVQIHKGRFLSDCFMLASGELHSTTYCRQFFHIRVLNMTQHIRYTLGPH